MVATPREPAAPFTQRGGIMDGTEVVRAYSASPLHVIKNCLGLEFEDKWREDHPRRIYRNSGLWNVNRVWGYDDRFRRQTKRKELEVCVTVGCACSGDCCGHMCSLTHSITTCGGLTIVVTRCSYNV